MGIAILGWPIIKIDTVWELFHLEIAQPNTIIIVVVISIESRREPYSRVDLLFKYPEVSHHIMLFWGKITRKHFLRLKLRTFLLNGKAMMAKLALISSFLAHQIIEEDRLFFCLSTIP